MIMDNSPPLSSAPPLTIADLELLISDLALTPDDKDLSSDDYSSVNDSAKGKMFMFRFWLNAENEQELALMQYLQILLLNRKFQPFVRMALRATILEIKEYYDYSNELFIEIDEMFKKVDWSKQK